MATKTIGHYLQRVFTLALDPAQRRRALLKRSRHASFVDKLAHDALPRPNYAYGMFHAAREARSLGLPAISVLEFGVAGAAGLLEMESLAVEIEREVGLKIEVYGFDTAAGMPPARDYRDMGYVWTTGQFAPHHDFRPDLKRSRFVIGDIAETGPRFVTEHTPAPIGFVSIDVDYYWSTLGALTVLDSAAEYLLPRVFVYLDDIIGDDHELHSVFTGELAACEDFNRGHETRKIAPIYGLHHKRAIPAPWNDQMFVAHIFDHPRYNEYTNPHWGKPKGQKGLAGVAVG